MCILQRFKAWMSTIMRWDLLVLFSFLLSITSMYWDLRNPGLLFGAFSNFVFCFSGVHQELKRSSAVYLQMAAFLFSKSSGFSLSWSLNSHRSTVRWFVCSLIMFELNGVVNFSVAPCRLWHGVQQLHER